ncbi:superoxide dismutase [Priestia taiwanensis]|uniref:superoxide dismutase n=1 Tax=Priestia taiwanensis TaxID=1347902 RepID=A0A917AI70_9BACI|nr:superoxide dismutase [Priestia taiwanensis]MBM7361553.1 Fe-Mn family superoxide dismutase [Priestia taiwanensis]GGE55120.1 superoxide dismutase [Priestia taiwanensis]
MSSFEQVNEYFSEVRKWCGQLLQALYKRGEDEFDKHDLADKVQALVNRIGANEAHYDLAFTYEVKAEVEDIQEEWEMLRQKQGEELERAYDDIRVGIGEHQLPPLPYPYHALEPYIAKEIMVLHHDVHHKSYVDGLNKAERKMQEARVQGNYELLKHWEREAAFHGSGHYLHTIFWNNMSRNGGGKPKGALLERIRRDFGSFGHFKQHFTEAANQVEGVGWALLVWSPRAHRLEILQTEKHQLFTQWDTIPLLVLDVWEHAYYLQYQTKRAEYVKNWWNIVNWRDVEDRYYQASQLKWKSY